MPFSAAHTFALSMMAYLLPVKDCFRIILYSMINMKIYWIFQIIVSPFRLLLCLPFLLFHLFFRKIYRQNIRIISSFRVKLCSRYPTANPTFDRKRRNEVCPARILTSSMFPRPVPLWTSSRWRLLPRLMYPVPIMK